MIKAVVSRWLKRGDAAAAAVVPSVSDSGPVHLCVDCRHHALHLEYPLNRKLDGCQSPKNMIVDRVRGGPARQRVPSCVALRDRKLPGFCGPKADWFEPKTKPPADAGKTQEYSE